MSLTKLLPHVCLICRMFAILAMTKLAEKPVDGYIDCA